MELSVASRKVLILVIFKEYKQTHANEFNSYDDNCSISF